MDRYAYAFLLRWAILTFPVQSVRQEYFLALGAKCKMNKVRQTL